MNILKNFFIIQQGRIGHLGKRLRNRLPEGVVEFFSRKIVPYLAVILIGIFSLVADYAQAADNSTDYSYSEDVMDLSPAEVAQVVSIVGPYTNQIDEDPVTVALAMDASGFIEKQMVTETKVTEAPLENRNKTITYTVQDGDTISKIGWLYGLKITTIKAQNSLSSDNIRPGQRLQLPPQDLSASQLASMQKKKVAGSSNARVPFSGGFRRPTSGWHMSQTFGRTSFNPNHDGIDLTSRSGTTIFAAGSGRVVRASRGWGGGYGNHIVIDHGQGWQTLYGHMSSFSVGVGQWVNQGQVIGIMGSSGWSTGVHLHFKMTRYGRVLNPLDYVR